MDPPLCCRNLMPQYGKETSNIASQKEVKNSTISWKNDADTFLECIRVNSGTMPRDRGNNSEMSILVKFFRIVETSYSNQRPRTTVKRLSQYCTIMPIYTLPPTPLKSSATK
jgi:hypothetical protein